MWSFSSIKEEAADPQARKPGNPRRSCRPTARVNLEGLRKSVHIKEEPAGPQARKPGNPRRSCRPTARVDLEDFRKSVETADLGAFHTAGAHLWGPALGCPSPTKALIRVSAQQIVVCVKFSKLIM